MNLISRIFQSSLGKKYVMALTGIALFGFVIGHLLGNLQVFGSPDHINAYAHFLKSKPGLIWGARIGLLAVVGLHILTAIQITAANRAARPVPYAVWKPNTASLGSRTMILSGLVILAFIIYHLLHFTALLPAINGTGIDFSKQVTTIPGVTEPVADVYLMMIQGFNVWWVAAFYLIAQALLFMHLGHGLASMFQSMGFRSYSWWPRIEAFAKIASIAIFIGYASIPIAVTLGLGKGYLKERTAPAVAAVKNLGKEVAK